MDEQTTYQPQIDPNPKQKLYQTLVEHGYYTKSFDEFQKQYSTPQSIDKIYNVVNTDGLYTKSKDEFNQQYFSDLSVKKKEQTSSNVGTMAANVSSNPFTSKAPLSESEIGNIRDFVTGTTQDQRNQQRIEQAKVALPKQKPLTAVQPTKPLSDKQVSNHAKETLNDPLFNVWLQNTDDPIGAIRREAAQQNQNLHSDINNYATTEVHNDNQKRVNNHIADVVQHGLFEGGYDAANFLKKQGVDTKDLSDEQLNNVVPNNETQQVALQKVKEGKRANDLVNHYSLKEAAFRFHNPTLDDKTPEQFQQENNATAGYYYDQFINNLDVQERAKHDARLRMQLMNAKNTLVSEFPEYASQNIASKISQKLEDEGVMNNLSNNPTKEQADSAVEQLMKEDKLSLAEKKLYEKDIVPKIQTATSWTNELARGVPIANAFADENPIKSRGVFENALQSFRNTIKGTAKTAEEATVAPALSLFTKYGLQDYHNQGINEQLKQTQFEPQGFGKYTTTFGNIVGMIVPTILGAKGLQGLGANEAISNGLSFALPQLGEFQSTAREKFKGNPALQTLYTVGMGTLTAALGGSFTNAISKGVGGVIKDDIAKAIEGYTSGELTSAAAKDMVKGSLVRNGVNFATETIKHSAKGGGMMAAPQLLDAALDSMFGDHPQPFSEAVKKASKEFMTGFWASTPLAAIGAMTNDQSKMSARMLYEQASHPDFRNEMVRNNATPEQLKNYDAAQKILNELRQTDVETKDLPNLLLHELNQNILKEKLADTESPSLKEKIKEQINISKEKAQTILNRQDVNTRPQDSEGKPTANVIRPEENKPSEATTIAPDETIEKGGGKKNSNISVQMPQENTTQIITIKPKDNEQPTDLPGTDNRNTENEQTRVGENNQGLQADNPTSGEGVGEKESPLTKEAEDLLSSIGEGSKPTFITKNLERIAKENGIEVTGKMSADDVVNALKEKQKANENTIPTEEAQPTNGTVGDKGREQQLSSEKNVGDNRGNLEGSKRTVEESKAENTSGLSSETAKEGFTEVADLNRMYADAKAKYGDKKGAAIYEAANRLVNPNKNTIVEIKSNGVTVKEGDKYIFKPFGNTDANSKKWTLYKGIDVTDRFATKTTQNENNQQAKAASITNESLNQNSQQPGEGETAENKQPPSSGKQGGENKPPAEESAVGGKLIDKEGKPLTFYHGSSEVIENFDEAKQGQTDSGFYGKGVYFSAKPSDAAQYAKNFKEHPYENIGAYHIDLKNPLEIDYKDKSLLGKEIPKENDGVIVRKDGKITEVVAKDKSQITKSDKNVIEAANEEKRTGVKKAITNEVRTERSLPKVELPKMATDLSELKKAKERIDKGDVNPRDLVNRILDDKGGYRNEDEVMDMQYYAHQLQVEVDNVTKQKDLAETPEEKATFSGQLQQLSDEIDRQTEAAQIAGNQWGKVGNRMKVVIDMGFNPSREKLFIKDAYDGEIPKDIQLKIDTALKERDEAIAQKNKIEELLKNKKANDTVSRMKKERTPKSKKDYKQKRSDLFDELKKAKEEQEKYLEDRGIQKQGFGFTLTGKMVKIIGEIGKTYVDEGLEKLEEVVAKVYDEVKGLIPGIEKKDIRDAIALYDADKVSKRADKKEAELLLPLKTSAKPQFEFPKNNEWVKAKQRIANAEYKMKVIKRQAFESQKNMFQKGTMWAGRVVRLSVLSGYNVLAKLAAAATIGGAGKRIPEQAIGRVWAIAFKGINQQAPLEGYHAGLTAELKFYKEFFNPKKFVHNSWEILKTGSSDLNKKYGSAEYEHIPVLYIPTDLHQIIKDPLKRATFEASFKNAMAWAEKNGLDIHDDLVVQSLEIAAYKRANYEIFQEQNALSRAFNTWKARLETQGNKGAVAKFIADFMIPVSTVPTNIVRRVASTSPFGLIKGSVDVMKAYRKGIENLQPQEADVIMRQLKQGSLGTALWLIGWFGSASFGGLYSKYNPDKKRKEGDLAHDEMDVGGTMLPKPVQHALPLEIIQLAATTRHIYDNYSDNKDAGVFKSIYEAGMGSIGAMVEQIPVIETGAHLVGAFGNPYEADKLKDDALRRFEPQILRETGVIPKEEKQSSNSKQSKSSMKSTEKKSSKRSG